jgi:AraC-like DNA-binding protein
LELTFLQKKDSGVLLLGFYVCVVIIKYKFGKSIPVLSFWHLYFEKKNQKLYTGLCYIIAEVILMNDYYRYTQNAIEYIKDNLHNEITLEEVAGVSKFSLYHFYRIFNTLAGMTIKECIRLRRLSMAAVDMRDTNDSIIDIANPSKVHSPYWSGSRT